MVKLPRIALVTIALVANFFVASSRATQTAGPFGGTPWPVPGTVESGDFDDGPSGESYWDSTAGNTGGAYRNTDVDIEPSADGGYDVGWADAGEWLNYTVNVQTSGTYVLQVRVASPNDGTSFHIGFNGPSYGTWTQVPVPNTGGWQSWITGNSPTSFQ